MLLAVGSSAGEAPLPIVRGHCCRSEAVNIRIDDVLGSGRVVGIVEDRDTSKPLDFTNVIVLDTTHGGMARNGGRFALEFMPPGVYRIKAQFVGYEPQIVDGVQVTANTTTVLKLCLGKSVECGRPRVVSVAPVVAVDPTRMETPYRSPARAVSIMQRTKIIPLPGTSVEEAVALNGVSDPRPVPPAAKHLAVQLQRPALIGSNARAGSRSLPTHALSEAKSQLDECGCNQAKLLVVAKAAPARPAGTRVLAEDLPKATQLRSNFPNPFNPSTKIRFDLAQRGRVDLVIFDLRGRRVRTLLRAEMEPGRPEVVWDGKDDTGRLVASGMYICRLVTGTFRDTRKLMVVR
jgi:hypothetical protein